MRIVETPKEMQALSGSWRREGRTVGFVPTMGALHEGHLSLVRAARAQNDLLVASIFVNPLQFGSREDLDKYERPFERDSRLLEEAGCDVLFAPSTEAMYGGEKSGGGSQTVVEAGELGGVLEGAIRPGHFRGVATIVAKLFNVVAPGRAYFGEKDYQQLKVIEGMVRDLFFDVEIVPGPTVREPDGLAMSSRTSRLSPQEREASATLYRALKQGASLAADGERNARVLVEEMRRVCEAQPTLELQYVVVVDAGTLEPLAELDGRPARALIAASVGGTHLIDNLAL